MPDTTNLILFMAATLALNLTPGPGMLYVIARSVGQGQRAGVVSALGIGGGCLAHTFAAAFGLSALLMSSAVAYDLVKTTINEFTTKLAKHRARNLPSHRGVD
ncbi:MAG TPA: LysE family transporter [Blastocatellia bacterium]|nr:LysE family transporter [Blastocatellia bacterium]